MGRQRRAASTAALTLSPAVTRASRSTRPAVRVTGARASENLEQARAQFAEHDAGADQRHPAVVEESAMPTEDAKPKSTQRRRVGKTSWT